MSTLVVGQQFGEWTIIGIDGKRAGCRCRCGAIRILAVDAIESGSVAPSCGCIVSREQAAAMRDEALERQRLRDQKNWRPSGDRTP
jgi:hypothetical protein